MTVADSFGRSGFARFVNSTTGRIARVVLGLGLIGWGYVQSPASTGIIFMVVGLVPLTAGAFDLCIISALLGGPLRGARIASSKPQS